MDLGGIVGGLDSERLTDVIDSGGHEERLALSATIRDRLGESTARPTAAGWLA